MSHHYLPQQYLRGFTADERLWVYDSEQARTFSSQPKSVANESDMYGEIIENDLASKIENPAQSPLLKITTHKQINAEEKYAFARYIGILFRRVPNARKEVISRLPSIAIEEQRYLHEQFGLLRTQHADKVALIDQRLREVDLAIKQITSSGGEEIFQNMLRPEYFSNIIHHIGKMNWVFYYSSSQEFITSDNPVFFFDSDGIGNVTSELTFPICSNIALLATNMNRDDLQYIEAKPNIIKEINRRTLCKATRFAFSKKSEDWIMPVIRKKQFHLSRFLS